MQNRNPQLARLAGLLAATAVSFGAIVTVVPLGADGATAAPARAARTISLNETGVLRLITKEGFTLNERGTSSGTISGPISVQLTIVSSSRVSAVVTISPKGGSMSGHGTASYHKGETAASFFGTLSIGHGSGSYAHARGSGLSFSGTIARSNEAITVHVSGRLSD